MQHILTEKEFADLKAKQEASLRLSESKLQRLCTKICNTMPVQWGWGKTKNDPEYLRPWGCRLTPDEEGNGFGYCDQCPVREICPSDDKEWSK